MKILVIGSGGREHALVWKLRSSRHATKIWCAPGNAGIATIAECIPIDVSDTASLARFAKEQQINLTVVGPEAPLALGIVNLFRNEGLKIFGPTQEAAVLETSKAFTKEFCRRHAIPQADYAIFSDRMRARLYIRSKKLPIVIKADGLAQGKGVVVARTWDEAVQGLEQLHSAGLGKCIVIEDYLEGVEASFMAVCDGLHVVPLAGAKDHKRAFDGDLGPNTGGMGAFSPHPLIDEKMSQTILEEIIFPAIHGMNSEGRPFTGILYAGLMIQKGRIKLLEFNVRLGDPEAQVILTRLQTDLVELFEGALNGNLSTFNPQWDPRSALCVVMASGGYPDNYRKGEIIHGLKGLRAHEDLHIFHSGTRLENGQWLTGTGRVLGITALGKDLDEARRRTYEMVSQIEWEGCFYRKDIGRGYGGTIIL